MAIHLTDRNALFVEIPKTGTTWVRAALNRLEIRNRELRPSRPGVTRRHGLPAHYGGMYDFTFTAVRHPVTWYESWWRYQRSRWTRFEPAHWHPQRCLEPCASDDFNEFIACCLERQPGYVSRMYEWYVGPPGHQTVEGVMRSESLADDLVELLNQLGYEVTLEQAQAVGPQNVSPKVPIEWDAELKRRILAAERPAMDRFYAR